MAGSVLKGMILGLAVAACGGFVGSHAQAETAEQAVESASLLAMPGARVDAKLTRVHQVGKAPMHVSAGVRVYVPASEGMSKEYLTRLVEAEIARGTGPLAVEGLQVSVRGEGSGYHVELRSGSTDDARALYERVSAALSR